MNNDSHTDGQPDDAACSDKIRQLNDLFRRTLTGGTVLMTAGIVALGDERQAEVLAKVRAFDTFTAENDPWDEHDMGAFEIEGTRIFWKIDYFDLTRAFHSPEPADPAVTERVITIMLADEY